jgi:hypothetical protein
VADVAQQKQQIKTQGRLMRLMPPIRLEHLWVLVALSAIGVMISLSQTVPNDFWWHLKAGQITATSGIPSTNIFAWTLPADTPFVYQSWLGEWLFYMLYVVGDLPFVVFARNMLGLAAFVLIAVEAQRRSESWRLASGAVLLTLMMSLNNLTTRTQNWSWIPFMVVFLLLSSYSRKHLSARWLVVLPLLMIFWVNAHGGFMMGLILTGGFVAGETLRRMLRQPHALNWGQLRALYIAALAMGAVTVINPLGFGVFEYVYDLLTDAPSQGFIVEWQPPDSRTLAGGFFYVGVLVLLAAFGLGRRRPTITDVILVCGFGWMAFVGVRYVVWFGMVAMPIAAQSLGKPRAVFVPGSASETPRPAPRRRVGSPVINLALTAFLVLGVIMVQPWFKPALPLPEEYQEFFAPMPEAPLLFSTGTPVQATEYLRDEPCSGNLFNEMGYGSYLIWALYPQEKVFIDPRVELYPLEMWEDYIDLTRGRDVDVLLAQYDIDCVMLDLEEQPALSSSLDLLPAWERTYQDEYSEVWRRVNDA